MRRALVTFVGLLLVLLLVPAPARGAQKNFFAHLERVEVEPYFAGLTRVTAFLDVVQMQGAVVDKIKPEDLTLVVGNVKRREVAGIIPYEYEDDELDLAIVLEIQGSFQTADELLADPLPKFVQGLPKGARVAVVTYGHQLKVGPLEDVGKAAKRIGKVRADDDDSDQFRLIDALNKAVKTLKEAKSETAHSSSRKMILVISDGLDKDWDPTGPDAGKKGQDEFIKLAKDASDAGIVVDSFAFSMSDDRPPFLNLGEISKKTAGTFRWIQNRSGFGPNLEAMRQELRRQMVATWFLPPDVVGGKTVKVQCKSTLCGTAEELPLESNERKAPVARCAGGACPTSAACIEDQCVLVATTGGHIGWGLWLGGPALLLGVGGLVLARKRKKTAAGAPGVAGAPGLGQMTNEQVQAQTQAQIAAALVAQAQAQQFAAARGAAFEVISGPLQGQRLLIKHGFMIGKAPTCDLVINDGFASTNHAQVIIDPAGACTLYDLGSTNGTFVNGVRMTLPTALMPGMTVRIGQTDLRFVR